MVELSQLSPPDHLKTYKSVVHVNNVPQAANYYKNTCFTFQSNIFDTSLDYFLRWSY